MIDTNDKVMRLAVEALPSPLVKKLLLTHSLDRVKEVACLIVGCFHVGISDTNVLETLSISAIEHRLTSRVNDVPKTA